MGKMCLNVCMVTLFVLIYLDLNSGTEDRAHEFKHEYFYSVMYCVVILSCVTHLTLSLYFRPMFSVMRTILTETFRLRRLRHWRNGRSIQEKVPLYVEVNNV